MAWLCPRLPSLGSGKSLAACQTWPRIFSQAAVHSSWSRAHQAPLVTALKCQVTGQETVEPPSTQLCGITQDCLHWHLRTCVWEHHRKSRNVHQANNKTGPGESQQSLRARIKWRMCNFLFSWIAFKSSNGYRKPPLHLFYIHPFWLDPPVGERQWLLLFIRLL